MSAPTGVATDAAGSLYIADSKNGRIVFIPNESGTLNTADQLSIITGVTSPSGVGVTGAGTVYVADNSTSMVYTYTRSSASQTFGNDPIGTQLTLPADLVSSGNLPLAFATQYVSGSGNTADFSVTPSVLSSGTALGAGFGVALTAGFKPTIAGGRQAVYTFASTNATAPTLTLTGTGITPVNPTTTNIALNPTSGTYGQTITATITVTVGAGLPTPTGSAKVIVDSTTYTPSLVNGVATLSLPGLSAGSHSVAASYPGDTTSSPSTATPTSVTLAKAPLTIVVNNVSKAYLAALSHSDRHPHRHRQQRPDRRYV